MLDHSLDEPASLAGTVRRRSLEQRILTKALGANGLRQPIAEHVERHPRLLMVLEQVHGEPFRRRTLRKFRSTENVRSTAEVEDARSLQYELGVVLEEAGETTRALAVFLELLAEAKDYRDVSARVERLTRVQAGG